MTTLEDYRRFADHFLENCAKQAKPDRLLLVWHYVKVLKRFWASDACGASEEVNRAFAAVDMSCAVFGYRGSSDDLVAFPVGNEKG
jgi:hypothetical protein